MATTNDDLVLCTSPDGWSLHAPGSTDEEIATGEAPYLVQGSGQPAASADYASARAELARRGDAGAPLALASAALLAAGWDTDAEDDDRIRLAVDADDGDTHLATIRAIVDPLGCEAEWAGSGNTAGDGLSTEDVIVTARARTNP